MAIDSANTVANSVMVSYELFHRSVYALYLKTVTDGKTDAMSVTSFARESLKHANRFYYSIVRVLSDYIAINENGTSVEVKNRIDDIRSNLSTRLDLLTSDTIKYYQTKLRASAIYGNTSRFSDREFDYRVIDSRERSLDPNTYVRTLVRAFAVDVYFISTVDALARRGAKGKVAYPDAAHANNGMVFDPNDKAQVAEVAKLFHPNTSARILENVIHS